MTAMDTYNSMKFDEAEARGRRIVKLEAEIARLEAENADLRQQLSKKKLKVGPPQHPGQLSIVEEVK